MADDATPTSFAVIDGRAYFTDADGDLRSVRFTDNPDFAAGETVLGIGLLSNPRLASVAGSAVDSLRALLKGNTTAAPTTDDSAASGETEDVFAID